MIEGNVISSSFAVESAIDVSGYCYNLTVKFIKCKVSTFFSYLKVKVEIINETIVNGQSDCGDDGDNPEDVTEEPGSRQILESMQRRLGAVNLPF